MSGEIDDMPPSDPPFVRNGIFPFLKLPAELRERIYHAAIQPITPFQTAAAPGNPDRVFIPVIAQTGPQVRRAALHYMHLHRPVEVSVHSEANVRLARSWVEKLAVASRVFPRITFTGRIRAAENEFFHITLESLDEQPFFRVRARPVNSKAAKECIVKIKYEMTTWLSIKVAEAAKGQEAELSKTELTVLIFMIRDSAAAW